MFYVVQAYQQNYLVWQQGDGCNIIYMRMYTYNQYVLVYCTRADCEGP